jgi:hypothetical protein
VVGQASDQAIRTSRAGVAAGHRRTHQLQGIRRPNIDWPAEPSHSGVTTTTAAAPTLPASPRPASTSLTGYSLNTDRPDEYLDDAPLSQAEELHYAHPNTHPRPTWVRRHIESSDFSGRVTGRLGRGSGRGSIAAGLACGRQRFLGTATCSGVKLARFVVRP